VETGHLADYKVLVLAVDEEAVSPSFRGMFEENGGLKLNGVARTRVRPHRVCGLTLSS